MAQGYINYTLKGITKRIEDYFDQKCIKMSKRNCKELAREIILSLEGE